MTGFKPGDIVLRYSYERDVFFKIVDIFFRDGKQYALLRGLDIRLFADAPLDDLLKVTAEEAEERRRQIKKQTQECVAHCLQQREARLKGAMT
ncbi:MAG: hypothetical protein H0Z39_01240 [Peptococcaceae bacterium]|nr:hypothetical protein [Peptococcaceae bacterium]